MLLAHKITALGSICSHRILPLGASWVSPISRLPNIVVRVELPFGAAKGETQDERLQELREKLESSDEVPFLIDNGAILRAAPKKKKSHSRVRMNLYAPGKKQIKHLDNLVRCPACGHVKRSHFMCMHCFAEIRSFLKLRKKKDSGIEEKVQNLDPVDERIIYPGKRLSEHERRLKEKDWIPVREDTLMYTKEHTKKSS